MQTSGLAGLGTPGLESTLARPRTASLLLLRQFLTVAGAIAIVMIVHTAIATGGTLRFDDSPEGHVQDQAEAFLAGQLHLKQGPSPELLALDDPYDVDKNF